MPKKVILDLDPGIDDAMALCMALFDPRLEVIAVTAVGGNVSLKEASVTVLFVEHDMEIVERYVSRVLAFYQGEIICDAPPAEALVDDAVQEYVIGKEHHAAVGGSAAPSGEAANA